MNVVITGANFGNKGAQSMLFTTVAVIRQKYPDAKIFFAHANKTPVLKENFSFEEIYFRRNLIKVLPDSDDIIPPPHANQSKTWRGIRLKKRLTR